MAWQCIINRYISINQSYFEYAFRKGDSMDISLYVPQLLLTKK